MWYFMRVDRKWNLAKCIALELAGVLIYGGYLLGSGTRSFVDRRLLTSLLVFVGAIFALIVLASTQR
jgi:hypothetical protein